MMRRTTARTPPPPPPFPVSTTVVCSRSTLSRSSSAMETLPVLPCYVGETNEPPRDGFRRGGKSIKFHSHLSLALIVLASCGPQRSRQEPIGNSTAPVLPAPSAPPAVKNPAPTSKAIGMDNRTGIFEPKGPIDPASIEAAGQVVQHYGALIEKKRFAEAAKLWSDAGAAADFAKQLDHPEIHLEIGTLGETEG